MRPSAVSRATAAIWPSDIKLAVTTSVLKLCQLLHSLKLPSLDAQGSSFHVFHNNPKVAFDQKAIDEIDHVLVSRSLHDENFVDDQILGQNGA